VINFPSPGFATLPITLHVSKLHLEGTALIVRGMVSIALEAFLPLFLRFSSAILSERSLLYI
jgi:hypothetical protein